MRKTRVLRNELDVWKVAWQQVDSFLERINGARDQDKPNRERCVALFKVARVIEHQMRLYNASTDYLSDPIIDRLPITLSGGDGTAVYPSASTPGAGDMEAWTLQYRKWRMPGNDELELAVGNLMSNEDGVVETVLLKASIDLQFKVRYKMRDPLQEVVLPSYPGSDDGHSIVHADTFTQTDIKEDDKGQISLFSKKQREDATNNLSMEVQEDEEVLTSWSQLCSARREVRRSDTSSGKNEFQYLGPVLGLQWDNSVYESGTNVVKNLRNKYPLSDDPTDNTERKILSDIATAANNTKGWLVNDTNDMNDAVASLNEQGTQDEDILNTVTAAADKLSSQFAVFNNIAKSANALKNTIIINEFSNSSNTDWAQRDEKLDAFESALDDLIHIQTGDPLFNLTAENGPIKAELDKAVKARISYPDGSLRILRAMEWMFLASWVLRKRWFRERHAEVLIPIFKSFRRPFVTSLRALVQGQDTGFSYQGLKLADAVPAPVGAETLTTQAPATLLPGLSEDIEAGNAVIVQGNRPTAALVLGLSAKNGYVELNIDPLKVSVDAQTQGSAGIVEGGLDLLSQAPGFTSDELRAGESSLGAYADGMLQQTLSLWSRLALLFGWETVEKELRKSNSVSFSHRLVPEPSKKDLHRLTLHGSVAPHTLSIAIKGLSNDYWEMVDGEREQRVARAGELLLLQGYAKDKTDPSKTFLLQTVVEVDSVYVTSGMMLKRMSRANLAQLSTQPLTQDEADQCQLLCEPEEPIVVILLRRTWLREYELVSGVRLRRDFTGLDLPSLAADTLLPNGFLSEVVRVPGSNTSLSGQPDRQGEYEAAREVLANWTRYAYNE